MKINEIMEKLGNYRINKDSVLEEDVIDEIIQKFLEWEAMKHVIKRLKEEK